MFFFFSRVGKRVPCWLQALGRLKVHRSSADEPSHRRTNQKPDPWKRQNTRGDSRPSFLLVWFGSPQISVTCVPGITRKLLLGAKESLESPVCGRTGVFLGKPDTRRKSAPWSPEGSLAPFTSAAVSPKSTPSESIKHFSISWRAASSPSPPSRSLLPGAAAITASTCTRSRRRRQRARSWRRRSSQAQKGRVGR